MSNTFYLTELPKIQEIIAKYNINANKKLGQNFLFDQNLTDKIVRFAGNLDKKTVIEIGPGPGLLTRSILSSDAQKIVAIERDVRCINALNEYLVPHSNNRLRIMEDDALGSDVYYKQDGKVNIIANLPYNISTELLFRWLDNVDHFERFTLMFQKEVAMRILAKPKTKEYSRISIKTQMMCDVELGFHLPPSAFFPPPKVTSTIVKITPNKTKFPNLNTEKLDKILKTSFSQRRKILRSSLKPLLKDNPDMLVKAGINPLKRPEELSLTDFYNLTQS